MRTPRTWTALAILVIFSMLFAACAAPVAAPAPAEGEAAVEAPAAEAPAADTGSIQIPEPMADKFNVAFVYVGPIGDGG